MKSTRVQIQDAKETFNAYIGHPLIGIYNVIDHSVVLFPCVNQRVRLTEDNDGNFVSGSLVDKKDKVIKKLTTEELAEYNRLGYAPRFLYFSDLNKENPITGDDFLSAHEYVTRLMGIKDRESTINLRGFAVTQKTIDSEPIFEWKSGSLNSPRKANGYLIKRIQGCEMSRTLQEEIKTIINPWSQSLRENFSLEETKPVSSSTHPIVARPASSTAIARHGLFDDRTVETKCERSDALPADVLPMPASSTKTAVVGLLFDRDDVTNHKRKADAGTDDPVKKRNFGSDV